MENRKIVWYRQRKARQIITICVDCLRRYQEKYQLFGKPRVIATAFAISLGVPSLRSGMVLEIIFKRWLLQQNITEKNMAWAENFNYNNVL
ncbi:MAG TPA: hypothetical protein VI278_18095 [Nitrososphaeraceae archaeon]